MKDEAVRGETGSMVGGEGSMLKWGGGGGQYRGEGGSISKRWKLGKRDSMGEWWQYWEEGIYMVEVAVLGRGTVCERGGSMGER